MGMDVEAWTEESRRTLANYGIFEATERTMRGPHGKSAGAIVLEARDWAVVVPVLEKDGSRRVIAVRQFRHGAGKAMTEFPGGVVELGEDPAHAAARELTEETGYRAGRIIRLGACSPNPAFMANTFHVFAALDLSLVSAQSLDEHEIVDVVQMPEAELFDAVGDPPWSHALMMTAAWYYRRWRDRGSPA